MILYEKMRKRKSELYPKILELGTWLEESLTIKNIIHARTAQNAEWERRERLKLTELKKKIDLRNELGAEYASLCEKLRPYDDPTHPKYHGPLFDEELEEEEAENVNS